MRLHTACLGSLLATTGALHCQSATRPATRPAPAPFLWRVEGPARGWLFGTLHVSDRRVTRLPEIVTEALENSHVLYTEIDEFREDLSAALRHFALPGRQTLDEVLPMRLWERLMRFSPEAALQVKRLRPWAAALMLEQDPRGDGNKPLDHQLALLARDNDLETAALETVAEQLGAFDGMTVSEQVMVFEEALDRLEKASRGVMQKSVIETWLAGDGAGMLAFFEDSAGLPRKLQAKYRKLLLDDRNLRMADRLLERMKAAPAREHFAAVGAAHMFGPGGLPDLVRARGYRVTQVVRELTTLATTTRAGGNDWRYTTESPPKGWERPGFDDQAWSRGPVPTGRREASDPEERWLRCTFQVPPDTPPGRLYLEVQQKGEAQFHVGGVLAGSIDGATGRRLLIPVDARALRSVRVGGDNVLAIHCRWTDGGQPSSLGVVLAMDRLPR